MQAIGFLSRREYSRQELRAKLLDSLRKRAREDAALVAATEAAARELAQALAEQPSNGIDDAFAPRATEHALASPRVTRAGADGRSGARTRASAGGRDGGTAAASASSHRAVELHPSPDPAATRAALATLTRGDGGALPTGLRERLAAVATQSAGVPTTGRARPSVAIVDDAADFGGAVDDDTEASTEEDQERADPEATVDELLDWLVAEKYLNETRFVESRVNARSRKQGTLRIKLELARHGLTMEPEQAAALRETEFARAQALWQRKFGAVATDARERAKQGRFLAARGFASDVVRRVVGGLEED